MSDTNIVNEIKKRRTFAIISHPDAGKTTLTEKLLLYSGMVRTAGMVRGRKGAKAASSDWMAMEQERGISITASAMQFPYKGHLINVLDTPGHQDFSEDTYRTLTAADCAIMVIDAGKGVEEQTKKLFKVCRMRGIPILTFVNKLDLPARPRLDLLQELEDILGIETVPLNWPVGSGKQFHGVVTLDSKITSLFEKGTPGGSTKISAKEVPWNSPQMESLVGESLKSEVDDELELLEVAGTDYSNQRFLAGELSPVFFGSALTNFGVENFFDHFVEMAPSPLSYDARSQDDDDDITVHPDDKEFSGFVFKIQANMNPRHRDSMAFIRVCSGKFERDMSVYHCRSGKKVRLSRSYTMKANERDTIDDAFAGDIVGVINPGVFAIGDTVTSGQKITFPPMPQFPPEVICRIRPKDVMRTKSFSKGIQQLCNEGAVQLLRAYSDPDGPPYVAAVGQLQFDVLTHRLKAEYNVETVLDTLPYRNSFYLEGDPDTVTLTQGSTLALDSADRLVLLFSSDWEKRFLEEKNPNHTIKSFL